MLDLHFTPQEISNTRLRWRTIDALRKEQKRLERQRLDRVILLTYFTFLFLMVL